VLFDRERRAVPAALRGHLAAAILSCLCVFAQAQAPPPPPGAARGPAAEPREEELGPEAEPQPDADVGLELEGPPAPRAVPRGDGGELRLKFVGAPVDMLLDAYAEQTGRTLLLAPGLPAVNVTLSSQTDLSQQEYLEAIEKVLSMHGIAIIREGETFLRVVPHQAARGQPMPILEQEEGKTLEERGELVSQLIRLKHIEMAEAAKAIEPLKHAYGIINQFESINSLLITDEAGNINRMVQVIGYIDQPIEAREEPHIIEIRFAKAEDIKRKLEEIIAESQEEVKKSTVLPQKTAGAPGVKKEEPKTPAGVIRARAPSRVEAPATVEEILEQVERGIIRGTVKMVADDRTNILIIITRPENMPFFEKIIQVLDVETAPDVIVRVIRLEYAQAKDVAVMLNDLIGAAASEEDQSAAPKTGEGEGERRAAELREYVRRQKTESQAEIAGKTKVGQLSKDNVKILSDERTNALIIMASKSDVATIEEIIADMDMMLSQVLIEAVIIEISLDESLETGVDWLQRSLVVFDDNEKGKVSPVMAFAGTGGGGSLAPQDALGFVAASSFPSDPLSGLTYYLTFFDINLDVVMRAVASDSRTRILSSPVIMTTDNKEAEISVATDRYFYKGKRYAGSAGGDPIYEDDVERQQVGITLTVTPRINEKKFVVMEIGQTIENISGVQTIDDTDWPIVTRRKLEADIAVASGETIVMGGLIQNRDDKSKSKVPILGDIPLLGLPFRSSRKEEGNSEVIVFITPYVLDTPTDIQTDARRRYESMGARGLWRRGWSDSKFADPMRFGAEEMDEAPAVEAEPEPEKPAETVDPMAGLDREILRDLKRADRRFGKSLNRADKRIEARAENGAESP